MGRNAAPLARSATSRYDRRAFRMPNWSRKGGADTPITKAAPPPNRPAALRLLVVGDGVFASPRLPDTGQVAIGRSRKCEVCVDHESLSRKHAILHIGPTLEIEDCGSRNGTRIGDRAVVPGKTM